MWCPIAESTSHIILPQTLRKDDIWAELIATIRQTYPGGAWVDTSRIRSMRNEDMLKYLYALSPHHIFFDKDFDER